jgi:tetratricopeptide (TPR) repeat protein
MFRHIFLVLLIWAAVCSAARASGDPWVQVTSPHFTLITDAGEKQGRHTLDQFERMRWVFATLFPKSKVDPMQPIYVVAARGQKTFDALEPAVYKAKGQLTLAGYFLRGPDRNYILVRLDTDERHPYATIYHEYTHLQFASGMAWLPLWFNEGFAEFMQNTEIRNKDVLLGEPSVDDILYLRQNRLLPLPVLFKVDHDSPYYHEENKASVFYSESWALTHYLEITDREKGTSHVQDYLRLVSQGKDSVEAAEQSFGDLKKLQAALESYIGASSYKQFVMNSAVAPIDESTYQVKPLTTPQADAIRADVLLYVQREDDARTLDEAVLKADPDNAQAHLTMGLAAEMSGDFGSAGKLYAHAAKEAPDDYLANFHFGETAMRSGVGRDDPDVEASLRASIRQRPSFAPAYDALAGLLAMHRDKLDEAYKLDLHAVELDPFNLSYRLNEASVLMVASRYPDAAAVLHAAMRYATTESERAMVQNHLKEVDSITALRATPGSMVTTTPTGVVDIESKEAMVDLVKEPKHPTEAPNGPKHQALGIISDVKCDLPATIEFKVNDAKKMVLVYSNNFFKIDLTVLGFTPNGDMNPCKDFEGKKARVQYAESSDKTVDGQVTAVELRK